MVYQAFYGKDGRFDGWRCIYCGEIIDPLILENREIRPEVLRWLKMHRKTYKRGRCNKGGKYNGKVYL